MNNNLISIIILVHNAPKYVLKTFLSLKKTKNSNYESIVVDNKSGLFTKLLLKLLFKLKYIDKLYYSKENLFFAKGNNFGATLTSKDAKYYLLLNSDIKIINPNWLELLSKNHKYGISAYGVVNDGENTRADGYCFLIDKDLYDKFKLDENFKWFWSITKLQGEVLEAPKTSVKAYYDHEDIIIHYGGKSGKAFKKVNANLKEQEVNELLKKTKNKNILTISAKELLH